MMDNTPIGQIMKSCKEGFNMTLMTSFYKVIVLKIGLFESIITDERHFGSQEEATTFKGTIESTTDNIAIVLSV